MTLNMNTINNTLYKITVVRPFMGKNITNVTDRYTEAGRDSYIKDITDKFGYAAVISVLEYNLVRVIK